MAPTTRHHTRRGTGWLATDSQSINFQQVLSPSQPRIVAVHVRRPSVVNSAPDTTNPSITFGWGIDERGYLREHDPIPQLPRGVSPGADRARNTRIRETSSRWHRRLGLAPFHIDGRREVLWLRDGLDQSPSEERPNPTAALSLVLGEAFRTVLIDSKHFIDFIMRATTYDEATGEARTRHPLDQALTELREDNPLFAHMFRDAADGLRRRDAALPTRIIYLLNEPYPGQRVRLSHLTIIGSAAAGITEAAYTGIGCNLAQDAIITQIIDFWRDIYANPARDACVPQLDFAIYNGVGSRRAGR